MWSVRPLSANGSTDTSAACLMTSFQSLSSSGDSDISAWGQVLHLYSAPVGRYTTASPDARCSHVKIPVTLSYLKG
jgi:hypothetical protein